MSSSPRRRKGSSSSSSSSSSSTATTIFRDALVYYFQFITATIADAWGWNISIYQCLLSTWLAEGISSRWCVPPNNSGSSIRPEL